MLKFVPIFIALSQFLAIAQQINDYAGDCGKLNEDYLINFNSTPAVDEFPWIGRVYLEGEIRKGLAFDRYTFSCLAVLISKRHLLIPAHCVANSSTEFFKAYAVILGAYNRCYRSHSCPSPVPNYYEIDRIALHPNFIFDIFALVDNNIAIITLKNDVSYNAEVSPICLPSKENSVANFVGQNLYYAGYTYYVPQPLKTLGHVASSQKCSVFDGNRRWADSDMCVIPYTREGKTFTIGSPLMGVATVGSPARPANFYLIGLNTRSSEFNGFSEYKVVSIGHHIEWIRSNIA